MKDKYIDKYGIDSLRHLMIGAKNGAKYFVTSNEELLKDRDELEKHFRIKIRTLAEMSKNGR
jgi:hypothetical protein